MKRALVFAFFIAGASAAAIPAVAGEGRISEESREISERSRKASDKMDKTSGEPAYRAGLKMAEKINPKLKGKIGGEYNPAKEKREREWRNDRSPGGAADRRNDTNDRGRSDPARDRAGRTA